MADENGSVCSCAGCLDALDPRTKADAQILRAGRLVVQVSDEGADDSDKPARDYTPDELDTLFFCLLLAQVQLLEVPGGREAIQRVRHNAESELQRRSRPAWDEAARVMRRTYGDDVDLAPGTTGFHLAKAIELGLDRDERMRDGIVKLAVVIRQR